MSSSIAPDTVTFRPSRVDGLPDVDEVRIHPDRLELRSAGTWRSIPLLPLAPGREIATGRAPVGELHFSRDDYAQSHVVFYTTPPLVIHMPADGPAAYPDSHFWRIQDTLRRGGFSLYENGPPRRPPFVLNPHPARTVAYVLTVFAVAWLYALSGFLPGHPGDAARHFFLHNPSNPAIGLAFMLPTLAIPALLTLRHGRSPRAVCACIALSCALILASEWALRRTIDPWAHLDLLPNNSHFGSPRHLLTTLLTVTLTTLIGLSWRRAFLEPIPKSDHPRPPVHHSPPAP